MKRTAYRKAGMLPPRQFARSFIAAQIRQWRSEGKVRRIRYRDAIGYQAEDKFNPYIALVKL